MTNIHVYPSYITNESRILKECNSIVFNSLANKVFIVGLWKEGLPEHEIISNGIHLVRLNCHFGKYTTTKILNASIFLVLYYKFFFFARRHRCDILNCHTLTLLPICVFLKYMMDIQLIYDPHELETETHESKGIRKKIARRIERFLVKSADHTIVVSDSIKKWYKEHYNLNKIDVIKNIPSIAQSSISPKNLKLTFGISPDQILFIYQGYLSISRGVKDILHVFENIEESKHIVFMGYGPLEEGIKLISVTRKNIHYLPASTPQEVLNYTSGADVGIHIIPNTCLNHFYCLPNKVFEYAVAGVPFIASNFPDIKNEFEEKNVAWFVEPGRKSLFELVKTINSSSLQEKKANCVSFKSHWRWEKQDPVYIHIFDSLRERRKTEAKEL